MIKEKSNILIIGNLHQHPSADAFLKKFIDVLSPSVNMIFILSGGIPPNFQNRVKWFNTNYKSNGEKFFFSTVYNYFFSQIKFVPTLLKLFTKSNVEFVIFLAPSPLLMLISKISGKKIIRYEGGSYSKQSLSGNSFEIIKNHFFKLFLEKIPRKLSTKIVIESSSSLEFQHLNTYETKIVIAPLYVDTKLFYCKKRIYERESILGYVGNLDRNKGFDNLIKAILFNKKYIKDEKLKILVIGEGELYKYGKKMVSKYNLLNEVKFIGWASHENLNDYLNEFKLLILPSHSEGLPNIILEAMASGTPVLTTKVGALKDLINDGDTGFIIEKNDPLSISNDIINALESPKLNIITNNALQLVNSTFTYPEAFKRWETIVDKGNY